MSQIVKNCKPGDEALEHDLPIKKTNLLLMIFFTFISCGFYLPWWFISRRQSLNTLQSCEKTSLWYVIAIGVFYTLPICFDIFIEVFYDAEETLGLNNVSDTISTIQTLSALSSFLFLSLVIMECFKIRKMLKYHIYRCRGEEIRLSGLLIVTFHIFYIQYKINRLMNATSETSLDDLSADTKPT
jgi:hypothetical protein